MGTLDFEEILGRVVEVAQEVTGARYGALGIFDEHRRGLSRFVTRGIGAAEAELIDEALGHTLTALGTQIETLAWVVTQLRPCQLDELGIEASLTALFERADLTGLVIDAAIALKHEPGVEEARLESAIEVTVFRVVQEALDNALRHGAARTARVRLEEHAGELVLSVSDDGCGFDAAIRSDGFGLVRHARAARARRRHTRREVCAGRRGDRDRAHARAPPCRGAA